MLCYGEDALTLWALSRKTKDILTSVEDESSPNDALVLFRPSFGRKGGLGRTQFGEFDFIIATPYAVHLGESKWIRSRKAPCQNIKLKENQVLRHIVFSEYYKIWITRPDWIWDAFLQKCTDIFENKHISKSAPYKGSLLAKSLHNTLSIIDKVSNRSSRINNILLLLDGTGVVDKTRVSGSPGFIISVIDVTPAIDKCGFVSLDISNQEL
jgi:hypothetical protein